MLHLLRSTLRDFLDDDCPRMAAAMAYYTVFSLPALLLLVLVLTAAFADPLAVERTLRGTLGRVLGSGAADMIRGMTRNVTPSGSVGAGSAALTTLALVFAATGAFSQLQATLNRVWNVRPDPDHGGLKRFLSKRILSVILILAVATLVLASFTASTLLASVGRRVGSVLPDGLSLVVLQGGQIGVTLVSVTLLFALVFRVMPDADLAWRDVAVGAAGTGVLFVAGELLIAWVLSSTDPGRAFGAAGSLAVILTWIYYSTLILFFGAEFTQVWTESRGRSIQPSKGAVRVVWQEHVARPGTPATDEAHAPPPGPD